jgi:hypothetical protein
MYIRPWKIGLIGIGIIFLMSYCSSPYADQGEDFHAPSKPIVCTTIDNVSLQQHWKPVESSDLYRVSQWVSEGRAVMEQYETLLCKYSTGSNTQEFVIHQWWWKPVFKKERKRK